MVRVEALAEREEVSIGRVVSRGVAAIGAAPFVVLCIGVVVGGAPIVALEWASEQVVAGAGNDDVAAIGATHLLASLATIALSPAVTTYAEARGVRLGDVLAAAARVLPSLLALAVVLALGIGLGAVLVVPGLLLAVIWAVAVPALVEERRGVGHALSRSRALTAGKRWSVLGLQGQLLVPLMMAALVPDLIVVLAQGGRWFESEAPAPSWYWPLTGLIQTLVLALDGAVRTSLYVELRRWKDGPAGGALADIFA